MFEGFESFWTPVALSRELRRAGPLPLRIAREDVVLFRDARGTASALIDRCPHRGARLSQGRVGKDGCLECPFHGWRFDGAGACTDVPLAALDGDKRAHLSATALPTRELGGLVWLFTGLDAQGSEPQPPPRMTDPAWVSRGIVRVWRTHWTRALENMLDFAHLPWVHRGSIGAGLSGAVERRATLDVRVEPTSYGFRATATLEGKPMTGGIDWHRPHCAAVDLGFAVQHIFAVPIDETTTRMIVVSSRRASRYNLWHWLVDSTNPYILREDQCVMEGICFYEVPVDQGEGEGPHEKSVASDAPSLAFRKWYRRWKGSRRGDSDIVPASRLLRDAS